MKTSTFYNPKLDNPSAEEQFLLRQRIRLMKYIKKTELMIKDGNEIAKYQLKHWTKKLALNEKKLGIK